MQKKERQKWPVILEATFSLTSTTYMVGGVYVPRRPVKFAGNGSSKRQRTFVGYGKMARERNLGRTRMGYGSVARSRGAAVTGEMKYFDCDRSNNAITVVTTTWPAGTVQDPGTTLDLGGAAVANPLCLFAPQVGAGLNQRIGRQVHVHKLKVTGTIAFPLQAAQAAADTPARIRLMLVMDKQTNAAQMTGAQLMRDGTSADTTICSYQNPSNFGRFQVFKDKTLVLQDPNLAGEVAAANIISNGKKYPFKFSMKFKNPICVRFNATNGGTVADIIDNSFHIVIGADSVALAPTIAYYSRVSYKE